jgi:hypothetical protein
MSLNLEKKLAKERADANKKPHHQKEKEAIVRSKYLSLLVSLCQTTCQRYCCLFGSPLVCGVRYE